MAEIVNFVLHIFYHDKKNIKEKVIIQCYDSSLFKKLHRSLEKRDKECGQIYKVLFHLAHTEQHQESSPSVMHQ